LKSAMLLIRLGQGRNWFDLELCWPPTQRHCTCNPILFAWSNYPLATATRLPCYWSGHDV